MYLPTLRLHLPVVIPAPVIPLAGLLVCDKPDGVTIQ